jgi:serine protease Do/serine protease DegQ
VNLRGELVGINTAIVSPAGGNVGIGFAIPINMAQQIQAQLLEHGEVRRGRIGLQVHDLTPELAEAFGIEDLDGAVVSQVLPDSPAAAAGLEPGDVVVAVDGQPISGQADLRNQIGLLPVGSKVELRYIRDGERREVAVEIGTREEAEVRAGGLTPLLAGATFRNLERPSPLYGRVEGVEVASVEPGSGAWRAGLRGGDVIMSVNREPVRTVEQLRERVSGTQGRLLLHIRRQNGALFLILQ